MTQFSMQLYSARKFPPLKETLQQLTDLGYAEVEGFGGLYGDLDALIGGLNETGLKMTSGHFGIDALENDVEGCLAVAKATGMKTMYCPAIDKEDRVKDAAGWTALGKRLEDASKPYVAAGIKFGWHNHAFEFVPTAEGLIPLDLMFAACPDLTWEIDIAWIIRCEADPIEFINKYADRINAVHLKDIAAIGECEDEDGWADVGHGAIEWAPIMAALQAAYIDHYVMEHDNPKNMERFARRSLAAAKNL